MSSFFKNPVLAGFHPDPSIVRVGDVYYLATSTFEWFPGVSIYQSQDLVNWEGVARPLDRLSLLDMRGEEASCGVWAPCLSHDGERFYLVYSDTRCKGGPWWDVNNYVITATDIRGPWSERVFLNRRGFDPSLFHDEDGRSWLLNMVQDPRPGKNRFAGIELREYDRSQKTLTGEAQVIYRGTALGATEGPHIYRRGGYYYLMCAEGGTSWKHAVTVSRSRSIDGPYEEDPEGPVLTSFERPDNRLQKAGHGCLVETPDGDAWLAHLCSRPDEQRRCILGRETALQAVEWTEDGWLRLKGGGRDPLDTPVRPDLTPAPVSAPLERIDFNCDALPFELLTLREPAEDSWCSLSERPGRLRLRGRMSLTCPYEQSLVGRRIQQFHCEAETLLDYEPNHYLQTAGLAAFYDDEDWLYLAVSHDESLGRIVRVLIRECGVYRERDPVPVPEGALRLGAVLNYPDLRFRWSAGEEGAWQELEGVYDAGRLSDDTGTRYRFTGAFFVLCAQDHTEGKIPADFQYFTLQNLASS